MRLNLQGIGCYLLVVQKSELPQTQLANVRTMNMLVEELLAWKHRDSDPFEDGRKSHILQRASCLVCHW